MGKWNCSLKEFVKAVGGHELSTVVDQFSRVGTDTRASLSGQLFIPLKGDRFDAHDFVPKAVEQGAGVVMVHEWRDDWKPLLGKASFVQVADTLKALQTFALYWRRRHGYQVAAITGSNGKTSTKEFASALLTKKLKVHASQGSLNNHWGVPISILQADDEITHLVLEMGMNASGEIFRLCQIAEPNVVVVTTVGRAHIGELGSQEKVAAAKEEIYVAAPNAVHIFNLDNEWTMRMAARSSSRKIGFSGFNPTADVFMRAQKMTWDGLDLTGHIRTVTGQALVGVLGRHNVVNLMAASALSLAFGLTPDEIWKGLGEIKATAWGRNQILSATSGARVLFDGYNANPDSMQALLKNLYEMEIPGRKFFVVGDMKELGDFSETAHREIGEKAASIGFQAVWYVGDYAEAFAAGIKKITPQVQLFQSRDVDPQIAARLAEMVQLDDLVAIKASRGVALERVLPSFGIRI
ncbi:MAG: UDP-N-acetylmuramoyl-tripeptide--D-alanyl-D-alanine ligase [Bdellovibrionales bacterium]